MTFNHRDWIRRFGAGLDRVVDSARHFHGVPLGFEAPMPLEDFRKGQRRRYRELGALANEHPYAAMLFQKTLVWPSDVPDEVCDVLFEHPVVAATRSEGSGDGFGFGGPTGNHWRFEARTLVAYLAKLSVRVGGRYAATRLHRFLLAGAATRLHAHEITVLHGLKVDAPIRLGRGAYLADYEVVRRRFALEEDPELWLGRDGRGPDTHPNWLGLESSRCALVRAFSWGSAFTAHGGTIHGENWCGLRYRFPDDHVVASFADLSEGRAMLLQLLSIVVGSKLVSHTVVVALPRWMRQIDPNLRIRQGGVVQGPYDVWPPDTTLSAGDVRVFAAAARRWQQSYRPTPPKIRLAVDRLVSSYGLAATEFGWAEPVVDVSIALESLYGPFDGGITRKLSQRAGWLLGGSDRRRREKIEREMCLFYDVRSEIVHGREPLQYHERKLKAYLHKGRMVARETLLAMLDRGPVADTDKEWNDLVSGRVRRR